MLQFEWIQKCHPRKTSSKKRRIIEEFIVDETLLNVGSELIWLWIAIEPESHQILTQNITQERNMLVAEHFLPGIVRVYGKHPVSTDGGTWYPMTCRFLIKTSYPFLYGEKPDRTYYAIYQG